MQKKLIAAAVAGLLAAPAFAQTNVTISGNVRAGWESYRISGCGDGVSCSNESRVSDQSSGLRFNVVEDLGGGLKAWAQLDYRGAVDSGALANSGNSGVGFMHDSWGKFTIGRWDVHYDETARLLGANRAGSLQTFLHHGMLSQVTGAGVWQTITNTSRTPNILMWDSPNWNGFSARLAYSSAWVAGEGTGVRAAGTPNPGGGRAWTGAVRYENGPWRAGYSYWNGNQESRVGATIDQRGHRLALGYNFAMGLKLGLAYDRSTLVRNLGVGDNRRGAWYIPVSYAWGPHAVYFQYAHAGDATNTPVNNTGANAWSIGYDYAFSKRTSAGIFYTKLNNKNGGAYDLFALGANGGTPTAIGGNQDARQLYIGMNHSF